MASSRLEVNFLTSLNPQIDRNPLAKTMGALDSVMDELSSNPAEGTASMLRGQAQGLAQAISFMTGATQANVRLAAQQRWQTRHTPAVATS